jgi:xylan 1,4-beta-xylosidase
MRLDPLLVTATLLVLAGPLCADPASIVVDAGKPGAPIRPLHGVNGGPLVAGGTLDLSAEWKALAPPLARLHDCRWPNPDAVDLHVVFPNPDADPEKPDSYDFARTDELVKVLMAARVGIVFRLGESIEHAKVKKHVHPPKDPARWAAACVGVVRHYTDGWANGFRYDIRYWEVWNEPDNRPAMWSGTDEDYFRLYAITATAIRARFPKARVGGPGLGNTGKLTGDALDPPPFFRNFLAHCRAERLPLDFFSWHCYTNDPAELARRAAGVRKLLDAAGFAKAESHLNEWNYLPDNDWSGLLAADAKARERWHERIGGPEGAAFAAAALARLQDAPVDAANYFTAEPGGMGLFNPYGVPRKPYFALKAVGELAGRRRLPVRGVPAGCGVVVGVNRDGSEVLVLAARTTGVGKLAVAVENLPWTGAARFEVNVIDGKRDLERVSAGEFSGQVELELPGPAVALIRIRRP